MRTTEVNWKEIRQTELHLTYLKLTCELFMINMLCGFLSQSYFF